MKPRYPIHYRAAELPSYNANTLRAMLSMRITEKEIKSLGVGQLLVKMEAAPCNPSDIAFMQGGYNVVKALPAVPGFEGCGIVADVGEGVDSEWIGKRVSLFIQGNEDGSWAEYVVSTSEQLIPAAQELSAEQASMFFVNPFTAWGLMEMVAAHGASCFVINAAGSRLSEYLLALAKKNGVAVIGIVRKEQTAAALANKGFAGLLVSTDNDFAAKLSDLIAKYNPTIFLDAVAGEQTGMIAGLMPFNSKIVVYGGLSGKEISGINSLQLIFKKLTITGFDLNAWFANTDDKRKMLAAEHLSALIAEKKVQNPVSITVALDALVQGLRHYLGSMSEGKMLIRF